MLSNFTDSCYAEPKSKRAAGQRLFSSFRAICKRQPARTAHTTTAHAAKLNAPPNHKARLASMLRGRSSMVFSSTENGRSRFMLNIFGVLHGHCVSKCHTRL